MLKTISFESMFEAQFNLSPNNVINEFRAEVNPDNTLDEYATEFVFDESLPADKQEEIFEAYEAWVERARISISEYQETLADKYAARNTTDELDLTSETRPDNPNNYRVKTVWAYSTPFTDGSDTPTSRDIWDRTTGFGQETMVMCEYGSYNPTTTTANAAAMMRMRKVYRNKAMWLTIGSISINLDNLDYHCGQHKCEFAGSFRNHMGLAEVQEYFVLMLLQHLGTHNPFNNLDYPFPPIHNVKTLRDEDDYKVFTHLMKCKNKSCNHSNMILGDW